MKPTISIRALVSADKTEFLSAMQQSQSLHSS